MNWKVIRLELASSGEFPKGSAGRSYLIRLPLTEDGSIDSAMLEMQPARATVRRYWPNQADMLGYVVQTEQGYAIRYDMKGGPMNGATPNNGSADRGLFRFAAQSIKQGGQISLVEPDGSERRFRVANVQ